LKYKYILIFLFLLPANSWSNDVNVLSNNCTPGLHRLGDSQFALFTSCEGALGNYIAIIMNGRWSEYGSKSWDIGDRFWYEHSWGKDVTSTYFYASENVLYVSTSSVYGNGGIYKLDLISKKAILFYPKSIDLIQPEEFLQIEAVKSKDKLLVSKMIDGRKDYIELSIEEKGE